MAQGVFAGCLRLALDSDGCDYDAQQCRFCSMFLRQQCQLLITYYSKAKQTVSLERMPTSLQTCPFAMLH